MRFVMFYHSLVSDWNHGNAHFLRGIVGELLARGHSVEVYEPADGWSLKHLRENAGEQPLIDFRAAYPGLSSQFYRPNEINLRQALRHADVVLVHEWNEPELIRRIGLERARTDHFSLLFHDTHHRSISDCEGIAGCELTHYDGVLAFGEVIRNLYLDQHWIDNAWTWHEAADVRVFKPRPHATPTADVVWIGNWGDNERTQELHEFLFEPVAALGLKARVHGVRYPDSARRALADAGIEYGGWLPNFRAPEVFAQFRATVHIPRRPYRESLPGIPTIRVFEALACGIPLVSAPWDDAEGLFTPGEDFLIAENGAQMRMQLRTLLAEPDYAARVAERGLETILARHTCGHRVEQLLEICESLGCRGAHNPVSLSPTLAHVGRAS